MNKINEIENEMASAFTHMKNRSELEFLIPEKFVIGIDLHSNAGFPSMKDLKSAWTSLSIFENICGFKPHRQSAEKEISKDLSQCVREIDNVPTSGFKIVSICKNAYADFTSAYKDFMCVTLEDPRGWKISINAAEFQNILECTGFNIENCVLAGVKLVYSWNYRKSSLSLPFTLAVADEHAMKVQQATIALMTARDVETIKPSAFEIGKVYSSKTSKLAGHKYMYLGKHDVYSSKLHLKAAMRGNYSDMQSFIDDKQDVTGHDKHVFYCIDIAKDGSWCVYNNEPGLSPYYVTSSISKLFDTVEDIDLTKFFMHNDSSKHITLEAVQQDMSQNALFNMVDFGKEQKTSADFNSAEDIYTHFYDDKDYDTPLKTFPFHNVGNNVRFMTDCGNYTEKIKKKNWWSGENEHEIAVEHTFKMFSISSYSEKMCINNYHTNNDYSYIGAKTYVSYKYTKNDNESKHQAVKKMFDDLHPQIMQYVFCNGKLVPPYQNLILNTKTYYSDIE